MPFLKHASHKLSYAIALATLSQSAVVLAETQGWSCKQTDNGWDCSTSTVTNINTSEATVSPASTLPQPVEIKQEAAPSTSEAAPVATTPEPIKLDAQPTPEKQPVVEPTPVKKIDDTQMEAKPAAEEKLPTWPTQVDSSTRDTSEKSSAVEASKEARASTEATLRTFEPAQPRYAYLDWYPDPNSTEQCAGSYIEPDFPDKTDIPSQKQPLVVEAAKGQALLGEGTRFDGSVKIVQGQRSLYSESATIDQVTGHIEMKGGATYREPGILLRGKNAVSNTRSMEATLYDAEYVLHSRHIRGEVKEITRKEDSRFLINEGTYTQCPPGVNSWKLVANTIEIDPKTGFGRAENATLRVGDVPIVYLPYFYFPIDERRQSGFLYPSMRYSNSSGLDIATPYYFNIAANIDDTFSPRVISKRGLLLDNEFRYLNDWSMNRLQTAYMAHDNLEGDNRWLLATQHNGRINEHWRTNIDYLRVSDDDYLDDLGAKINSQEESHLNESGSVSYIEDSWQAELLVQSYQTIDDNITPYRRLPQLEIQGQSDISYAEVELNYLAQITEFDRNIAGLTGIDRITGQRIHLEPTLSKRFGTTWGYVEPKAKLWYSQFQLKNQQLGFDDAPSTAAPVLSLNTGLYFDRQVTLLNKNYQQSLEPRLFALYVPKRNQDDAPVFDSTEYNFDYYSLFRDNRFSGYDLIGDTQQISLGLTSRLFDRNGREAISASVGQAYYFADRTVELANSPSLTDNTANASDIATSFNWKPNLRFNVRLDANFDHEDFSNTNNNVAIRYQEDIDRIISLSYRYAEDVREQSTASFMWPVSDDWSALGVWQYDWLNQDAVDIAFGLEYESCCWKTRVMTRRWLQSDDTKDNAIYLQFVLKGLGSFGGNGGSSFVEKITGFEQREETNEYF